MDWIKKNYDRCVLILIALILVGSAGLIYSKINSFPSFFTEVEKVIPEGNKLPEVDTSFIGTIRHAVNEPPVWSHHHPGSLFVSRHYIVLNGKLEDPMLQDAMFHPPIPNQWLIDHGLDLLNPNILNEDPDGDGFTVLDEFVGGSDPNDKASRPSYSTKLRLKRYHRRPFRLKFAAHDGDSFQINTLDIRQPSQFLKLGDEIAGTKFKILKFERKNVMNESTGMERDVSELTIQNTETNEEVVLIYNAVVDSPDSFALFAFLWDNSEFFVQKDKEFALKPEPKIRYRLLDVNDQQAVITDLEKGNRIIVPALK